MTESTFLRRWLREPLLWFFLAGGVCFAAYAAFGTPRTVIEITPALRKSLAEDYVLLNGRPLDEQEMRRLIDDYIVGEMLFYEALSRDLLLNDVKTRSRMIEKMRFILGGIPDDPSEQQVRDFYIENSEWYTSERQFSYAQVFFDEMPGDPAAVLADLEAGNEVSGDWFWLGDAIDGYSESMLRGLLGNEFVDAQLAAPLDTWTGPLISSRGVHFVRMQGISEAAPLPYEVVASQVARNWAAEQQKQRIAAVLDSVKDRYEIVEEL